MLNAAMLGFFVCLPEVTIFKQADAVLWANTITLKKHVRACVWGCNIHTQTPAN